MPETFTDYIVFAMLVWFYIKCYELSGRLVGKVFKKEK